MPVLRYFTSIATPAALTSNINASTTALTLDTVIGYPTSYPFTISVDFGAATEELMDVTSAVGTALTVVRGVDGTSAQSHGIGAAVRHVASGRDFADYQNHQAASSAVHGVTGTVVGTSDTQTLTNKTLTGAALSGGGSMAGTWTGSPTFSGSVTMSGGGSQSGTWAGSPTFSGTHNHTGPIFSNRANATDTVLDARVTGDTISRYLVTEDGTHYWGPGGSTSVDTNLYRNGIATLATDGLFRVWRATSGDNAISVRVTGDTVSRFVQLASGTMLWGPGGATAGDTNLYRGGADLLKTDDNLEAVGYLKAGNSVALAGTPTAASGWSLTQSAGFRSAGVVSWYMLLTRTGADLTANSTGNISDTDVVTVPGEWRPPSALIGGQSLPIAYAASVTGGTVICNSSGLVRLADMHSGSTISTGDAIRFGATFVVV